MINEEISVGNDLFSDSSPDHVPLTLVRWLSPYPRAVLCDLELRPVCDLPFILIMLRGDCHKLTIDELHSKVAILVNK